VTILKFLHYSSAGRNFNKLLSRNLSEKGHYGNCIHKVYNILSVKTKLKSITIGVYLICKEGSRGIKVTHKMRKINFH
jgi:hypothetical protein